MTAKEYLEQLPDLQLRINSLKRKIEVCHERGTDISIHQSDGIHSNTYGSSKVVNTAENAADLSKVRYLIANEFLAFKSRAVVEINRIPNNLYAALLMDKYVNGLTWEEVAENIGKDFDYTRKVLHSKALESFDKFVPPCTRKNPVIPPADMLEW